MMKTINENVTHFRVSSYADDTKVLHRIRGKTDELNLQEDLVKIYNWATEKNIMFNGKNFKFLDMDVQRIAMILNTKHQMVPPLQSLNM